MTLSFGNNQQTSVQGTSVKMGEGVFVDHGTIIGAAIVYDAKEYENGQYTDDVALRLKLRVEGLQFDKDLYIGGNYKRTPTTQGASIITDWGGAFKVRRVFDELGIEGEVDSNGRFPSTVADLLIGRELYYLQYASYMKDNGKPGYRDYKIVAAVADNETEEETRQRLYQAFLNDVNKGWVKNFHPEYAAAREGATSGNGAPSSFGSTIGSPAAAPQGNMFGGFMNNSDLPF